MGSLWKSVKGLQLLNKQLTQSLGAMFIPTRGKRMNPHPKKRHLEWLPKPERLPYAESLTPANKQFIDEYTMKKRSLLSESPLKDTLPEVTQEWTPKSRRTGLIAKKIGVYPMWLKNGKKVNSTLLQVVENEVVKYISPEAYDPVIPPRYKRRTKFGCLVIGVESVDPQLLRKEYYSIFDKAGVMPKKHLMRFNITPDAVLEPGTQLYANHFRPGDVVDIRAKTIDRGFQGVMKRWGFKGMPASHGQTKTHRRPGNIGSGSARGRVVPGTKLPGHMGNRWRVHRGLRVLRVNSKYNVIWVLGHNIPGETNSLCYMYDTILPRRQREAPPPFPTYFPGTDDPQELYANDVHKFEDPTITYTPES